MGLLSVGTPQGLAEAAAMSYHPPAWLWSRKVIPATARKDCLPLFLNAGKRFQGVKWFVQTMPADSFTLSILKSLEMEKGSPLKKKRDLGTSNWKSWENNYVPRRKQNNIANKKRCNCYQIQKCRIRTSAIHILIQSHGLCHGNYTKTISSDHVNRGRRWFKGHSFP